MRRFYLMTSLLIALVLAVLIAQLFVRSESLAASQVTVTQSMPSPIPAGQAVTGDQFSGKQAPNPDFSDAPQGAEAIEGQVTESSVRSFLQDHAQAAFHQVHGLNVTSVQFMSVSQLAKVIPSESKLLSRNFPQNKQIAYVTVTGEFYGDGEVPLMHRGYCVFDAVSGNILLSMALEDGVTK